MNAPSTPQNDSPANASSLPLAEGEVQIWVHAADLAAPETPAFHISGAEGVLPTGAFLARQGLQIGVATEGSPHDTLPDTITYSLSVGGAPVTPQVLRNALEDARETQVETLANPETLVTVLNAQFQKRLEGAQGQGVEMQSDSSSAEGRESVEPFEGPTVPGFAVVFGALMLFLIKGRRTIQGTLQHTQAQHQITQGQLAGTQATLEAEQGRAQSLDELVQQLHGANRDQAAQLDELSETVDSLSSDLRGVIEAFAEQQKIAIGEGSRAELAEASHRGIYTSLTLKLKEIEHLERSLRAFQGEHDAEVARLDGALQDQQLAISAVDRTNKQLGHRNRQLESAETLRSLQLGVSQAELSTARSNAVLLGVERDLVREDNHTLEAHLSEKTAQLEAFAQAVRDAIVLLERGLGQRGPVSLPEDADLSRALVESAAQLAGQVRQLEVDISAQRRQLDAHKALQTLLVESFQKLQNQVALVLHVKDMFQQIETEVPDAGTRYAEMALQHSQAEMLNRLQRIWDQTTASLATAGIAITVHGKYEIGFDIRRALQKDSLDQNETLLQILIGTRDAMRVAEDAIAEWEERDSKFKRKIILARKGISQSPPRESLSALLATPPPLPERYTRDKQGNPVDPRTGQRMALVIRHKPDSPDAPAAVSASTVPSDKPNATPAPPSGQVTSTKNRILSEDEVTQLVEGLRGISQGSDVPAMAESPFKSVVAPPTETPTGADQNSLHFKSDAALPLNGDKLYLKKPAREGSNPSPKRQGV